MSSTTLTDNGGNLLGLDRFSNDIYVSARKVQGSVVGPFSADDLRAALDEIAPRADGLTAAEHLQAAWDTAEVPTAENPVRKGDRIIEIDTACEYHSFHARNDHDGPYSAEIRVAERAPRPEWESAEYVAITEGGERIIVTRAALGDGWYHPRIGRCDRDSLAGRNPIPVAPE